MPSSSYTSGRSSRGAISSKLKASDIRLLSNGRVARRREHILTSTRKEHGMAFELPDLPYAYDALEPHIDAETMRIHHDLHHGAYVTNANAALEGTPLADSSVESVLTNLESLPDDKQTAVRNNAGGHANHLLFWQIMSPDGGGGPGGALRSAVDDSFGSF